MRQEPSQQFCCPRSLHGPIQREEQRPLRSLAAEERVRPGIGASTARAPSRHGDLLFTRPFVLHISALSPKPKFPRSNRINIPRVEGRSVPERRCNHLRAEVSQAYEMEHWAESLDPAQGSRPPPASPSWTLQGSWSSRRDPGRGTGFNLDSAASHQFFWASASYVHPKVESLLQKV